MDDFQAGESKPDPQQGEKEMQTMVGVGYAFEKFTIEGL